eukprot:3059002-Amphidinium_carterae.1
MQTHKGFQVCRQPACPDGFAAGIKNGCSTPRGARSTQMAQPLQPRLKKAESDLSPQDLELDLEMKIDVPEESHIADG